MSLDLFSFTLGGLEAFVLQKPKYLLAIALTGCEGCALEAMYGREHLIALRDRVKLDLPTTEEG